MTKEKYYKVKPRVPLWSWFCMTLGIGLIIISTSSMFNIEWLDCLGVGMILAGVSLMVCFKWEFIDT